MNNSFFATITSVYILYYIVFFKQNVFFFLVIVSFISKYIKGVNLKSVQTLKAN